MWKYEHYRICGYVLTLAMHIGNTLVTKYSHRDPSVLVDPKIKELILMEDSFFTIWNIFFQMSYATFGLYCEIGALFNQKRKKKWERYLKYRKTFFCANLWPSTWFVFTAFWSLFFYDRSIIFPEYVDQFLTLGNNIVIHAVVVLVVLWETTFLPLDKPKSHMKHLAMLTAEFAAYISWIIYVNSTRKLWPYPILQMLEGTIYFVLFLGTAYLLLVFNYYTHWRVRQLIWSKKYSVKNS